MKLTKRDDVSADGKLVNGEATLVYLQTIFPPPPHLFHPFYIYRYMNFVILFIICYFCMFSWPFFSATPFCFGELYILKGSEVSLSNFIP